MSSRFAWTRVRGGTRAALIASVPVVVAAASGLVAAAPGRASEEDMAVAAAPAETAAGSPLRGWSPVVDVEFGVHVQELKAAGASSFGARDTGANTVSTLLARLETGIATPPLALLPGAPRLVVRGGGSFSTRETATISSAQRIEGAELGTDFSIAWKDMWHVGFDLRFEVPLGERSIFVQPGIEYMQSRFRFEPLFTYRAQPGSPEAEGFPNPRNPPTLNFRGRSGTDYHKFIGPSLAVDGEVVRVGPLAISVYLQGRMYWLLGDRDTLVSFTAPLLDETESATARMESNNIAGQVGFGLRGSF